MQSIGHEFIESQLHFERLMKKKTEWEKEDEIKKTISAKFIPLLFLFMINTVIDSSEK